MRSPDEPTSTLVYAIYHDSDGAARALRSLAEEDVGPSCVELRLQSEGTVRVGAWSRRADLVEDILRRAGGDPVRTGMPLTTP
jgi:hypothetical protein